MTIIQLTSKVLLNCVRSDVFMAVTVKASVLLHVVQRH